MTRLRPLLPLRFLQTNFTYQRLPTHGSSASSGGGSPNRLQWPVPRRFRLRTIPRPPRWVLAVLLVLLVLISGLARRDWDHDDAGPRWPIGYGDGPKGYYWTEYHRLGAYLNGIRTLTRLSQHEPENRYNQSVPPLPLTDEQKAALPKEPPIDPIVFDPYPDYDSSRYLNDHQPVQQCYLDARGDIKPPDVYVYPGLPLYAPDPTFGSYTELGFRDDVCFDRFGRLGPYGYGYNSSNYNQGLHVERAGSDKVFAKMRHINYTTIDWGVAQKNCNEKNQARFAHAQPEGMERVLKHAYVLRTWVGYRYDPAQIMSLRAMVNELALKSGGEYDVHFLVHVKDDRIPIWADADLYRQTLEANVPQEFWNISTLWSEQMMRTYYPGPFGGNFANLVESSLHGAYRSPHFALQWFSQQHPEYDFVWNWEMDLRYTGHYYDFNSKIGEWAKRQPRRGLWERSKRFWFPQYHGDFQNFTLHVDREIDAINKNDIDIGRSGPVPIWGPVLNFSDTEMRPPDPTLLPPHDYTDDRFTWGVGEEADLIVFNPIFDPSTTNWVFRRDATGYPLNQPIPPRRAAIVTVARLSRRLLDTMHEETWRLKHSMFPEMWPASVALHHGLKAVYAPHPVFFHHDWDLAHMEQQFNSPREPWQSPFGWGEHMLLGSTFYYNSGFSAMLWRRWLGLVEDGRGGREEEEGGMGRLCLRPILHHPVKREDGPEEMGSK